MNTLADLATVDDVQEYLTIPTANRAASKDEVQRFLTGASSFLIKAINRYPVVKRYTEIRDGTGGARMILGNAPVVLVNEIKVNGLAISQSPDGTLPGYVVNDAFITLIGYTFTRGFANVRLDYYAGWVPAAASTWVADHAYELYDFIVDSNSRVQQVTMPGTSGATQPTWATALGGTSVDGTVTWTRVEPSPEMLLLERAAIELTAQKWKRRTHVDESSYSMGGQITTQFSTAALPDEVRHVINQLRWSIPIPR